MKRSVMQLNIFEDICERKHKSNSNSLEAHDSIVSSKQSTILMILRALRFCDQAVGMTCDEIETQLALSHQTASARFSEMKRDGLIYSKMKRKTRSGRNAASYVLTTTGARIANQ